jgi:hypothetical protein
LKKTCRSAQSKIENLKLQVAALVKKNKASHAKPQRKASPDFGLNQGFTGF